MRRFGARGREADQSRGEKKVRSWLGRSLGGLRGPVDPNHNGVVHTRHWRNRSKSFYCDPIESGGGSGAFWTHSIRAFLDDPPWGEGVQPEATEKAAG